MIIKLYKTQKQYKKNISNYKTKARFLRGDDVIVISGDYKGCISKIKRRYNNNYYFLEKTKELNKNLEQKIKSSKNINEINIKVHESNISHYDINAKSKSNVRYFYIKNSDSQKLRIRVYKSSGTEKPLYVVKNQKDNKENESEINKDDENDLSKDTNNNT